MSAGRRGCLRCRRRGRGTAAGVIRLGGGGRRGDAGLGGVGCGHELFVGLEEEVGKGGTEKGACANLGTAQESQEARERTIDGIEARAWRSVGVDTARAVELDGVDARQVAPPAWQHFGRLAENPWAEAKVGVLILGDLCISSRQAGQLERSR